MPRRRRLHRELAQASHLPIQAMRDAPDSAAHHPETALPAAHQAAFLHDSHLPIQRRQQIAQHIGQTQGNLALQRMINVQRQAEPTLRQGSRSDAVATMQMLLEDAGAKIQSDGIFGPATRNAVIAYQKAAGLQPDGIVGPQTWSSLKAGGVKIDQVAAGMPPGMSQAIMAKLGQIKAAMAQIKAQHGQINQNTATPHQTEVETVPNHDSAEEDDSWWNQAANAASSAASAVGNAASSAASSVGDAAESAWGAVSGAADEAWNAAGQAADSAWGAVTSTASSIGSAAESAWGATTNAAGGAWDTVKEVTGINEVGEKIDEIVKDIQTGVNEIIDDVVQGISETAKEIAEAAGQLVDIAKDIINNPEKILQKLDELLNGLNGVTAGLFGNDDKEPVEVFVDSDGKAAESIVCHDSPDHTDGPPPGYRRLPLQVNMNYGSSTHNEAPPAGEVNHDSVRASMSYTSDISTGDDSITGGVPSDDFGTTGSRVLVTAKAKADDDVVIVDANLRHRQSSDVTNTPGNREDIGPGLENITSSNWQEAANDLDPEVARGALGAPMRKKFWCRDLTVAHEAFHCADADQYMRNSVLPHLSNLYSQHTIDVPFFGEDEAIKKQVRAINDELETFAVKSRNDYMRKPGGETRAYSHDSAGYQSRASAIRMKAEQEGWIKKKR